MKGTQRATARKRQTAGARQRYLASRPVWRSGGAECLEAACDAGEHGAQAYGASTMLVLCLEGSAIGTTGGDMAEQGESREARRIRKAKEWESSGKWKRNSL